MSGELCSSGAVHGAILILLLLSPPVKRGSWADPAECLNRLHGESPRMASFQRGGGRWGVSCQLALGNLAIVLALTRLKEVGVTIEIKDIKVLDSCYE